MKRCLFLTVLIFCLLLLPESAFSVYESERFQKIDRLARENRYDEVFREIESLRNDIDFWESVRDQKLQFRNFHELYLHHLSSTMRFRDCIEYVTAECSDFIEYPVLNLRRWEWEFQLASDPDEVFSTLFSGFEEGAFLAAVAKDMDHNDDLYRYLIFGYRLFRDKENSDRFKFEYLSKCRETEFAIDLTREDYFAVAVEQDLVKVPGLCDEFLLNHYIPYFQERVIALKLFALRESGDIRGFESEVKLLMQYEEYACSPVVLNAVAYNYLETKRHRKKALEFSTRAVSELDSGSIPEFYDHLYPADVWEKLTDEFRSSVYFNHSRALLEHNETGGSVSYLEQAKALAHRGCDDEDTMAQFYYQSGLLNERLGDFPGAVKDYYSAVYTLSLIHI